MPLLPCCALALAGSACGEGGFGANVIDLDGSRWGQQLAMLSESRLQWCICMVTSTNCMRSYEIP